MEETGLSVIPLHNQIITMGEWGWMLGVKQEIADSTLIHKLKKSTFEEVDTRWINQEALNLITSFGKDYFKQPTDTVRVNKIHDPVLYRYFLNGTWDLY
jgi:spermidine synthase